VSSQLSRHGTALKSFRRQTAVVVIMVTVLPLVTPTVAGCKAPQTVSFDAPVAASRIVRCPSPTPYISRTLGSLPAYDPSSLFGPDLRFCDLTELDLAGRADDLLHATFSSATAWPEELPDPFDPAAILEFGKNPGLGVHRLHAAGITGKGVGLGVIDKTLLVDHKEYADRVRVYDEISGVWGEPEMHAPGVLSVAAGDTCGVSPEAALYFIAAFADTSLAGIAPAIDRVVEINRLLPLESKIRVLSISAPYTTPGDKRHRDEIVAAIERANAEGILVITCSGEGWQFMGLEREPLADPDRLDSYGPAGGWVRAAEKGEVSGEADRLLVPMNSRTVASHKGTSDYVFYRFGGFSWTAPYIAGLYALACQVNRGVDPDTFWHAALETGHLLTYRISTGADVIVGTVVDPVALLERIAGRSLVSDVEGQD